MVLNSCQGKNHPENCDGSQFNFENFPTLIHTK